MNDRTYLCDAYLKQRLHYEPTTGIFTWLVNEAQGVRWNQHNAGKQAGTTNHLGYVKIGIDGLRYVAHQLAFLYMTGGWPELVVDHIDGNPSNNAWNNLRACTQAQNQLNRKVPRNSKTGVTGVSQNPQSKRWSASLHFTGKYIRIGTFDTFEEAKAAREEAERIHYGEFARQKS